MKAGARIGPYSVIGRQCHIEEHAVVDAVDRLGEHADQPGSDRAPLDSRPPLPHRPQRLVDDGAVLGDKSVVTDYSRL